MKALRFSACAAQDLDVVLGNRGATIPFFPGGPSEEELALNRLLANDGTAHFTDVSAARLPPDLDRTAALALGDIDGDRDVDLVVGNLLVGIRFSGQAALLGGGPQLTGYVSDVFGF